jgi:protocatechuate 3,4-dioxygenase beta subunit
MLRKPLSIVVLQLTCTWSFLALGTGPVRAGESAADLITYRGRVLDRQGQPVAGAKVMLCQMDVDEYNQVVLHAERIGEKVTGPDGAFTFTGSRSSEVERKGYLIAQKEGFALGWDVWTMDHRGQSREENIVLGEPQELSGLVVDEGGSPIGDAEVRLGAIGGMFYARYMTLPAVLPLLTVRTDSQGRFVFANLPANPPVAFLAHKPGRVRICTLYPWGSVGGRQFAPDRNDIKLTLPPEAKIEGKVVEKASGKPVGGVRVMALREVGPSPFLDEPVTSKADGTFSIAALAAGTYTVQLAPQVTGTADWVAEPVPVSLQSGETVRDLRLALTEGCLVEVLVKEETGEPVARASVQIVDTVRYHFRLWRDTTDAGGMVRARLSPGAYEVGGIHEPAYMYGAPSEKFTIADDRTRRFERILGSLPAVTGVVYDEAGVPLEGVKLQILQGGPEETSSDAQGRFRAKWDPRKWAGTPPARYVIARHAQRNLAAADPAGKDDSQTEVRLRPGITLAGQVTDPNGKALAGSDIEVVLCIDNWRTAVMSNPGVKTDAQGRYEVGALPARQWYDVKASADHYGQIGTEIDATEIADGRVPVRTLALPLANLSVSGVVVDPAGQPIVGASVSCFPNKWTGQPGRFTRSDAAGKFVLEHVCAGALDISSIAYTQPRALSGELQTEGGARDVRLVLTEGRSSSTPFVPGTPVFLRGKPLPELKSAGVELPADANDRMLLVCLWDLSRQPSRHCFARLDYWARWSGEKRVTAVALQAGKVEPRLLNQWLKRRKPPFPVGCLTGDIEKARSAWGAVSLPHLILTDKKHIVVAEGFTMDELEAAIQMAVNNR